MEKSDLYHTYWGKADQKNGSRYHLLPYHCLDVAAVGKRLLESHHLIRSRLADVFQLPDRSLIQLCCFLLAIHDIGKFSDVFQNKRADTRKHLQNKGEGLQSPVRHDILGYVVWLDLWNRFIGESAFGFGADHDFIWELEECFNRLVCCATGHHGYPSRSGDRRYGYTAKSYFSNLDIDAVYQFCIHQWRMHVDDHEAIITHLNDEHRIAKSSWWIAIEMIDPHGGFGQDH